jgi:hypothetical protein
MVRCLISSAHLVNPGRRLLGFGLDRDEAHRRPAHRLADRRRVRRILLVPPDIGFRVGRRDQPYVVAQSGQLARPVMRRGTGFHADQAARQLGEERQNLGAAQRPADRHRPRPINPMHLEQRLGQIQADRANPDHS